jgi:hypothetical protein
LSDIIHSNQTSFVHGYIGDNIKQVLETKEHYDLGNQACYS